MRLSGWSVRFRSAMRIGRVFESDPNWASLREDPRFVELMARVRHREEHRNYMKRSGFYVLLISVPTGLWTIAVPTERTVGAALRGRPFALPPLQFLASHGCESFASQPKRHQRRDAPGVTSQNFGNPGEA
jgi:hypothetical protein